jgi:hypothetical protein
MSFNSPSFGPAPRACEDSIFRALVLVHEGRPASYYKFDRHCCHESTEENDTNSLGTPSTLQYDGVNIDVDDEKDLFAYHWEFFNVWFRCKPRCD